MSYQAVARYGEERLPRYTSYPTAPSFSDAIGPKTYGEWLAALPTRATTSLYLHVPFCRSMCWYCGCHTTVTPRNAPIIDYLGALRQEIELVAARASAPLHVQHVHFGGGTPTILETTELFELFERLHRRFHIDRTAEIAIEVDPRTLTTEMTVALGRAGVTRASLGVQSFDSQVQRAINRIQTYDETARAADGLRAAGVRGLNLDLIYGLPFQTVKSCEETARMCVSLRPDRFSVFGYAHIPSFKKHQQKIPEAALPDGENRYAQAEAIADVLTAEGYVRIGLDHYARPDDAMARAGREGALRRNFQGYTTDQCDALIGFGASAIGRLPSGYVQNDVVLGRYAERVSRGEFATVKGYALTPDDRLRAELIERVMCDFKVDVGEVCARHGVGSDEIMKQSPRLRVLEEDGVIRIDGDVVGMSPDQSCLVRTLASAFDAYLGASGRVHSRAV